MDLTNFDIADLRSLDDDIKTELKKREHRDVTNARDQIAAIAKGVGMSVSDLVNGNSVRTKAGTVAVKYRNPGDTSQQWTGRGRQPKWVKDWIAGGKSLDAAKA